ncbi:RagB/SusD family nutrient uptake outer membrane protein [Desertivirga xinjiangensis]|uniref:RagB/SusD family nutrient uptake outer membrane protein n=1 Tax=Desertivirga xinjiangensis TaxID=539206 RepID=UPI0021096673|nr:RagB/SusD family nutrient uptake outer membrane protein [Pedobacter xinjiangensis]
MRKYSFYLILIMLVCSCKEDWLDIKSDISKIVPQTLADMRLLLNSATFNLNYTTLGEVAADNISLNAAQLAGGSAMERNAYVWEADIFAGSTVVTQWNSAYNQVFTANVVLEGLEKITDEITPGKQSEWNDLKGRALFYRARAHYDMLVMFTKPYAAVSAGNDPGIPLRLSSDIHAPVVRAGLQESYDQVISDLKSSLELLPTLPSHKTEPSKAGTEAMLARVYMAMGNYENALDYAEKALLRNSELIDYNTLTASTANPFAAYNAETIYFSRQATLGVIVNSGVDGALYASYTATDLRKALYFRSNMDGSYTFKASYAGSTLLFGGTASPEMYLIKAECLARKGETLPAMETLNTLLEKRYDDEDFVPLEAGGAEEALRTILAERRKELVFTGLRWQDLRRLNQDPRFAVTLVRSANNKEYRLEPGSNRYTFPIPDYIISSSGMAQNPR